jgi:exopolysaccharide biosynthesis polyprenyl glycosylphosphotransferase
LIGSATLEGIVTQFKWSSLSFTQKSLDLAVLVAALGASAWILHIAGSAPILHQEWGHLVGMLQGSILIDFLFSAVLLLGWNLCLCSLALYDSRRLARWRDDLFDVMRAVGLCTLTLAALAQVFEWKGISSRLLLLFWLLASVWLFAWRWLKRVVLREVRLRGRNLHHVIIVGAGRRGQQLTGILKNHPELGLNLLGFIDNLKAPGVIGPFEEAARILAANVVDEIMIALPVKKFYSQINEITRIAEEQGIVVRFCSELFDLHHARMRAEQLDDLPVFTLYCAPLSTWGITCKRMIDITGAAALLIILSPVMLLIALLIRLTSPGPALFMQERVGFNKQRFPMFKFRTMVADAEKRQKDIEAFNEASGPVFKIRNDPRITPLGRWLRKLSLDELPQLLNVLRGELSLVGPRPLPVRDFERFNEYWFNRRFSVKPGITCIWQVSGRSDTSFDRWIQQDLEYIDNWSLALDLKLLLKTIPAVLRGTGAM